MNGVCDSDYFGEIFIIRSNINEKFTLLMHHKVNENRIKQFKIRSNYGTEELIQKEYKIAHFGCKD